MPNAYTPCPQPINPPPSPSGGRGGWRSVGRSVVRGIGAAALVVVVGLMLTALALGSFATLYGSFAHPSGVLFDLEANPQSAAPVAIVVGAGIRDGALDRRSGARTETAVRLFVETRASRLHFSGGSRGTPPVAALMRDYAIARGVPAEAISVETASQTTLQNAVLTREALGHLPAGTLLVTDAAHLPRAWASFVWAGYRDLQLVPADPSPGETAAQQASFIVRETLALWYNAGRMAAVSLLLLAGTDPERTIPLLDRLPIGWRFPT
jgi:uncharacterized SAM-binding protein YcdF (DUF218 family)